MIERKSIRRILLLLILTLYVFHIPWYRGQESEATLFGAPAWLSWAFISYILIAITNAITWYFTDIDAIEEEDNS